MKKYAAYVRTKSGRHYLMIDKKEGVWTPSPIWPSWTNNVVDAELYFSINKLKEDAFRAENLIKDEIIGNIIHIICVNVTFTESIQEELPFYD